MGFLNCTISVRLQGITKQTAHCCDLPVDCGLQVAGAVSEDALYLLVAEFEKGLEDATRRPGAAVVVTHFCSSSKLDYQEHVPSLLTVCFLLMGLLQA